MTVVTADKVEELHQKLSDRLMMVKLGDAGRVLYFDSEQQAFILAMHTMSPEKTEAASSLAWDSIPEDLKMELREANLGFAGKQV